MIDITTCDLELNIETLEAYISDPSGQLDEYKRSLNLITLHENYPDAFADISLALWSLTEYKPKANVNINRIERLLDACELFFRLNNYKTTLNIFLTRLENSSNNEVHRLLSIWGYFERKIELFSKLLGKLGSGVDAFLYNQIGESFLGLGKYDLAKQYYQNGQIYAQKSERAEEEGMSLRGLSKVFCFEGEILKSIEYSEKQLENIEKINCERNKLEQKIMALQNSAVAYNMLAFRELKLNNQDECNKLSSIAQKKLEESIDLCESINDFNSKAIGLQNLAICFKNSRNMEKVLETQRESLALFVHLEDIQGQAKSNLAIGHSYKFLNKKEIALQHYQDSLQCAEHTQNTKLIILACMEIYTILMNLGRYEDSIYYYNLHFDKAKTNEVETSEEFIFGCVNLGVYYINEKNYVESIKCLKKCLEYSLIKQQKEAKIIVLNSLANAYFYLKNYKTARRYGVLACLLSSKIDGVTGAQGKSYALGNIGISDREMGKNESAVDYLTQAKQIAEEVFLLTQDIDDYVNSGVQSRELGLVYVNLSSLDEARNHLEESEKILSEANYPDEYIKTLLKLGNLYIKLKLYEDANSVYRKCQQLNTTLNNKYNDECLLFRKDLEDIINK